jgi:hypothetical protein
MHQEPDGSWRADLDPVPDTVTTPTPASSALPTLAPAATPAMAPVAAPAAAPAAPSAAPPAPDPSAPGFALPSGLQPGTGTPPAGTRSRNRRLGRRGGVIGLLVVILVVAAKLLLFSGAFRLFSVATAPTYHAPASIAGDAKSSDPSIKSTVSELVSGIQLPSLQGGHVEGAGYADSQGTLDYMIVIGQDNANDDSPRTGMDLDSQFAGVTDTTLSPLSTSSFNGVTLDCATATTTSGTTTASFNACDWYNSDAAGFFVDDKSATLPTTVQLATSVLTAMTK